MVEDIRAAYDVMHDTSNAIDSEVFAALVRSQGIDVFVELTGFSPGQTTATITIVVHGDKTKEANETFFVNLTGGVNGTIADSQGIGTIVNDDGATGGGKGKPIHTSVSNLLLTDTTLSKTVKRK